MLYDNEFVTLFVKGLLQKMSAAELLKHYQQFAADPRSVDVAITQGTRLGKKQDATVRFAHPAEAAVALVETAGTTPAWNRGNELQVLSTFELTCTRGVFTVISSTSFAQGATLFLMITVTCPFK